jgi:radical SAM superfamily enzyme YgiQ (UPF0313 family)
MSLATRRTVLLVQLPIPPLGPAPIRGNVPLAGAYLKLFAEARGLGADYALDVFPAALANTLGDQALVAAIAAREPWLVGFTCYLWNVERTLWVARELKCLRPGVRVVLGGPEVTADNAWLLEGADYDFAVLGEGEQTFANLLLALLDDDLPPVPVAGLYVPAPTAPRYRPDRLPTFRTPLPDLNRLGSPYLAGILDAAEERLLLLETTRGCVFRCKFCYYPKSYDKQYYLSHESVLASLGYAGERGAAEVVLLDPTLNQRKDFADFLRLLARGNPGHRFTYFGELRAEGVTEETARLLRAANFTEVEVGLQSIQPEAMALMQRNNNLRAFERGARALLGQGIRVKVDLIVGLPGDTVASVRRGLHYLRDAGLSGDAQVFNLAVLPGTAFRQEARQLGLVHQPRPPYYVLRTPTLDRADLFGLMREAQELFDVEFDAPPRPVLDFDGKGDLERLWRIDLDRPNRRAPPPPERRAQAFTLWLRSACLGRYRAEGEGLVRRVLRDNPFTTLQVVLEPAADAPHEVRRQLSGGLLGGLLEACQELPTYLDQFYALQPGGARGAKRLIVLLPLALRAALGEGWIEEVGERATLVWRGADVGAEEEMAAHEYVWAPEGEPLPTLQGGPRPRKLLPH